MSMSGLYPPFHRRILMCYLDPLISRAFSSPSAK